MSWRKTRKETRYWGGIYSPRHGGYLQFAQASTFDVCEKRAKAYRNYFATNVKDAEIKYTKEEITHYELA